MLRNTKLTSKIVAQVTAARGMAQFAQGFGFDLADALAGDIKILTNLFERMVLAIEQTKA